MPENQVAPSQSNLNPIDLAAPVARQVKIQSIFLVDSHTYRAPEIDAAREGYSYRFEITRVQHGKETGEKVLYILASFKATLDLNVVEANTDPLVLIQATFALVYTLESVEGIEDSQLQAFAATSGIFNVWPFWREFVQSSSIRMGLPQITVPIHRVSN